MRPTVSRAQAFAARWQRRPTVSGARPSAARWHRRTWPAASLGLTLLVGCAAGGGPDAGVGSVELSGEDGPGRSDVADADPVPSDEGAHDGHDGATSTEGSGPAEPDDGPADADATADGDGSADGNGRADGDGSADGDGPADAADDGAGDGGGEDAVGPLAGLAAGGVIDLAVAEPGTWPVGNAGTVTFELDRRDLVLRDIAGAPGWSVEVLEDDRDELEVRFRRGQVDWRFLVERSGRHLEIEIEQRIERADTGGYDIGDAGTFAFQVDGGRLALTSLEVSEGWELRERDVDDDTIDLELRADDRRVDVEVELDGPDRIELVIEYRVRSRFR